MSPDGVARPDEPPHDPGMDARVSRLEDDLGDVKATLRRLEPMIARIDAILPHLATKVDLMDVRTELKTEIASVRIEILSVRSELKDEIADVKVALADKPSRI